MASFYEGYSKRRDANEQVGMRDLAQASSLMQLQQAVMAQREQQEAKSIMQQGNGNLEAVLQGALKAGRTDIAAKLAPLIEAQRKAMAKPDPRVLAPGGRLVSPTGEVIAEAPFKPEAQKAPTQRQRYDGTTVIQEELQPDGKWKEIGKGPRFAPEKPPEPKRYPTITTGDGIYEHRPEGLVQLKDPKTGQPLKPTARERPITEYQGKNAMYGVRATMADKTLTDLEEKISVTGLAAKRAVQDIPVVGGVLGAGANVALSKDQQKVEQAQRNFVNAVLRQESGAVINPAEFENAIKQYFPQPGDKKEVITQKRANRRAVIDGFKKIAGPAWQDEESLTPGSGGWSITPVP
jgi:hypothetical protein